MFIVLWTCLIVNSCLISKWDVQKVRANLCQDFRATCLGIWIKGKSISGSTHGLKSYWPFGYRALRILGDGGVSMYLVTIIEPIFENSLSTTLAKTVINISTFSSWLITLEEKWMLYLLRIICTYSWGSVEHRALNSSCERGLNLCATFSGLFNASEHMSLHIICTKGW